MTNYKTRRNDQLKKIYRRSKHNLYIPFTYRKRNKQQKNSSNNSSFFDV